MLAFTTHDYFFFSRKEIWFYAGEEVKPSTYNVYSAAEQVPELTGQFVEKYKTVLIDLSKSEQELFNAIHPRQRDYIRTAEKKSLQYQTVLQPSNSDCGYLIRSFQEMAKKKGITFLTKRWLSTLQQSGNVYITKILSNNIDLVTHVYIFDKKSVLLTNTFHNMNFSDNTTRGEANKLLHWKDILLFKSMNFHFYDFGGINPEKLPGITKFKLSFGGEVKEKYRYIQAPDFFYLLIKLFKKIRN